MNRRLTGAEANSTVAGDLQTIRTRADSALNLQGALEAFVAKYPKDARTADFTAALKAMPMARSLDAWQTLADSYAKTPPGNGTGPQQRVDAITAFLTANPTMPLTSAANTYLDYLKHEIDAQSEKGPWQTAFNDIVTHPYMAEMYEVDVSNGKRYYTRADIKYQKHSINQEVNYSFEALSFKDDKNPLTTIRITIDPPNTIPDHPALAPHAQEVAEIAAKLKEIGEGNWDTFGLEVVEHIAHNEQIDPVVKAILMQAALKGEKEVTTWGGKSPIEEDCCADAAGCMVSSEKLGRNPGMPTRRPMRPVRGIEADRGRIAHGFRGEAENCRGQGGALEGVDGGHHCAGSAVEK